jgi:Secretion system C-terminal sorting domain
MIMNAATLDLASSTSCTNFAQGPCPAPHSAELISPTIKVTKGTPMNVSFYQSLTHFFESEYFVEWSKDGGKTWVSIQINEDIPAYEDNVDPYKSVRLIGSETADSIKIKFRYDGNYYHWAIDDVKLIKREANNLAVTDFYAVTPNLQQPAAQAETLPFAAAVENIGAATQTKLKLYINVVDSTTNARIFRDSVTSASIAPNQIDTAVFAPKYLPNKKGTYAMIYQAAADSADYDRFDNLQGHYFKVTDTTFAKEFGATFFTSPAPSGWDAGEPHSAAYGNSYFITKGKGNYLRSVTFGINNGADLAGTSLIFSLYKWNDRNFNANVEPAERTLVADNFYDIKGTETGSRLITLPFPEDGESPIQLEDSTTYLIMCEYFAGDDTDLEFLLNDSYDRYPMLLTGFAADKPRYASFTELDSDLPTATYFAIGYGFENVYVLRMNVGPLVITSDKDLPSISNEFAISPNPARESIYLQLALNQVAKQTNVRIMDLAGRAVIERVYNNIQRDQFQFSVEGLPAGTYLMQVTTENGTGTKKFVVSGK